MRQSIKQKEEQDQARQGAAGPPLLIQCQWVYLPPEDPSKSRHIVTGGLTHLIGRYQLNLIGHCVTNGNAVPYLTAIYPYHKEINGEPGVAWQASGFVKRLVYLPVLECIQAVHEDLGIRPLGGIIEEDFQAHLSYEAEYLESIPTESEK